MDELLKDEQNSKFHLWFTVDRTDDPSWKYR